MSDEFLCGSSDTRRYKFNTSVLHLHLHEHLKENCTI